MAPFGAFHSHLPISWHPLLVRTLQQKCFVVFACLPGCPHLLKFKVTLWILHGWHRMCLLTTTYTICNQSMDFSPFLIFCLMGLGFVWSVPPIHPLLKHVSPPASSSLRGLGGERCEGFIRHRPPGPHPRICLALPS